MRGHVFNLVLKAESALNSDHIAQGFLCQVVQALSDRYWKLGKKEGRQEIPQLLVAPCCITSLFSVVGWNSLPLCT